ncbi:hypothetical protein [Rhodopirellula baltica]|uniref:hypothetical protein n=1 Tax=Rhodopirellula baltica TaxID=265606 RepID=UPI00055E9F36|nr:hypothetical protein [Rhodopirellula baltica]
MNDPIESTQSIHSDKTLENDLSQKQVNLIFDKLLLQAIRHLGDYHEAEDIANSRLGSFLIHLNAGDIPPPDDPAHALIMMRDIVMRRIWRTKYRMRTRPIGDPQSGEQILASIAAELWLTQERNTLRRDLLEEGAQFFLKIVRDIAAEKFGSPSTRLEILDLLIIGYNGREIATKLGAKSSEIEADLRAVRRFLHSEAYDSNES